MPQQTRVHNPGPYEVVIDNAGHQLAGSTSANVSADRRTASLLAAGLLILLADPTPLIPKKTKAAASDEASAETGAK